MYKGEVFSVHAMKAYRCSGGIAPLIINFGTRWKRKVLLQVTAASTLENTQLPIE